MSKLRHILQHFLVVLDSIKYLPIQPTTEDVCELKQADSLRAEVEEAIRELDDKERQSN